ncbi:hypothetical protein TNCV_2012501 [Trichonephila clavipes]|nr:hypothetical protein TNCV_2012501 [Trichonephila clavipes]
MIQKVSTSRLSRSLQDPQDPHVYQVASVSNLDKLEGVQLSAARVITGLRNSCLRDIVRMKLTCNLSDYQADTH